MEGSSTRLSFAFGTAENDQSQPPARPNELECFICMEPPTSPVSASCGHFFCCPCMYRWLENRPKPCPVCRHILRRDIDIIPLYGAGSGAGVGFSNGRGVPREIAASGNVIPPRPSNPQLVTNTASMDSSGFFGNFILVSYALNTSCMLTAYESAIRGLSDALGFERDRVHYLGTERIHLEVEVIDLIQLISDLTSQLRERDWQLCMERDQTALGVARMNGMEQRNLVMELEAHESRERGQWHVVPGNQMTEQSEMAEQGARQQQQLDPASSFQSPQSPEQSDDL